MAAQLPLSLQLVRMVVSGFGEFSPEDRFQ